MKIQNELLNLMAKSMGIDEKEVELRKDFLNFNDQDSLQLQKFNQRIDNVTSRFIEDFYKHLLSFEQMRELVPDPNIMARLRESQAEHFSELTAGQYDLEYIKKRLKIGYVHQQVGLQPKWYMGAYSQYLSGLLGQISKEYPDNHKQVIDLIDSLLKIVFLDMGLAIDAYFYVDQQKLVKLKEYSEQVISQLPNPLVVIDYDLSILYTNEAFNNILNSGNTIDKLSKLSEFFPCETIINLIEEDDISHQIKDIFINKSTDKQAYYFKVSISKAHIDEKEVFLLILEDLTDYQRLQLEVQASVIRMNSLINNIADAVITIDEKGVVDSINASAEKIFGYNKSEIVGKNITILMTDGDQKNHEKYLQNYIGKGQSSIIGREPREVIGKHKNGKLLDLELAINEMPDVTGRKFIGVLRDISVRKQTEKQMRTMQRVIEQTAESVMITDTSGIISYVNPAFEKLTLFKADEVIGLSPNLLKSGIQSKSFYQKLWNDLQEGKTFSDIFVNRKKNGELFYEEKMITPIRNDIGEIIYFVSTGTDITEQMQIEEHFHYVAHHDALTELPNRLLFGERLEQAFKRTMRHGGNVSILIIDIDRFKVINDTLGHDTGDLMLKEIANRLKKCVKSGDTVARFSGDEFVVLLDNMSHANTIVPVVRRILSELEKSYRLPERELYITASIGISLYPMDGADVPSMVKHAEVAMYRAKETSNKYQFYSEELGALALKRLNMEASLRSAINNNEFVLNYQPQISLKTNDMIGVEALIRWNHPELGLITPDNFIPILEETGLINEVGEWVLETTIKQCKNWNEQSREPVRVSINVSSKQLVNQTLFVNYIESIVSSVDIPLDLIEIEITESLLMLDPDSVVEMLNRFRSLGISVAIDDFGTGYSSLSYLKRLPIDKLKIDKSFVMDICSDKDSKAIASAIISMAHDLGMKVIAEGVEELEQLEFLKSKGCDYVQGYYVGRPLEIAQVDKLLL